MKLNCIFFPFTHITQNQLDTLLAFFPSFQHLSLSTDYQKYKQLEALVDQGKIDPIFLSARQLGFVESKALEYLSWAKMNKGNEHNLKLLLKENPYFTSPLDVTAIKSQIRGAEGCGEKSETPDSSLQQSLLFLKMAQLCDEQTETIDLELENFEKTRKNLFTELRGVGSAEGRPGAEKSIHQADTGKIMTRERIEAFSRCFFQEKRVKTPGEMPLFVTTSQAVFDYLQAICKDVINALDIDPIKVHENECKNKDEWQRLFGECLEQSVHRSGHPEALSMNQNDTCAFTGQVKLSFFSGDEINLLLGLSDKQIPVCLIKLK
jgi:hypothetical protein